MCSICNNTYPNCPVCTPTPRVDTCEECLGEGKIYFDENGETITREMFLLAPNSYHMITCEVCNGEGEI